MIDAKKAKELTQNIDKDVEELLKDIEENIMQSIAENKYSLHYVINKKKYPNAKVCAIKKLEQLGYKIAIIQEITGYVDICIGWD